MFADKLAQELLGSAPVKTALHQRVEHKAVLIDGAPEPVFPEPVFLAVDRDDDLVELPFFSESRCATPDLVGKVPPEFLRPAPDSFIADHNSVRSQQVFDHP